MSTYSDFLDKFNNYRRSLTSQEKPDQRKINKLQKMYDTIDLIEDMETQTFIRFVKLSLGEAYFGAFLHIFQDIAGENSFRDKRIVNMHIVEHCDSPVVNLYLSFTEPKRTPDYLGMETHDFNLRNLIGAVETLPKSKWGNFSDKKISQIVSDALWNQYDILCSQRLEDFNNGNLQKWDEYLNRIDNLQCCNDRSNYSDENI